MTPLRITLQGDVPEPDERLAPAIAGPSRDRRPFITAALVLSFIAGATLVLLVFQPFANAAGGCGGG